MAGNSIAEYSPSGTLITTFSGPGSALGKLSDPIKLGFDTSGNVFVSDTGNHRVEEFDSAGNFKNAWSAGTSPVGLAVNGNNQVYVTDIATSIITKYDSAGNVLTTFVHRGTGAGQFNSPYAIAVAPTGEVYVADTGNSRVERWFDPQAWTAGTNSFASANVGPTQLLGTTQTLSSGKVLTVSGTTTINSGGTLTVSGGSFSTGSLALAGAGATFQVSSGTYSIGSLSVSGGASFQVPTGQAFTTSGTATVGTGGTVTVNGTLLSSGVNVSGTLAGGGQISGPLTNNNGGDVRVAAGQQLTFLDTGTQTNAGLVEAIGGPTGLAQVEFYGPVANAVSTGLITARGRKPALDAGLTNNGALAASFGQANIFGDVTNNGSGNITIGAGQMPRSMETWYRTAR